MRIYLLLALQLIALSLHAQRSNSVTVSFLDNYLSESQVEVKTNFYPFSSSQIGINFGIATDLSSIENDHSAKIGVIMDLYRQNKLSISLGARFVFERFYNKEFNALQVAYNYDFPIDIKYDFLPRYNLSVSLIPTWNKYFAYSNGIALNYSLGLGYYF